MIPISIIIIYTLFIIPYTSVFKELRKFCPEIKETFDFFIKRFKNSKSFKKFLNLVLIIFISILVIFISPIFILYLICYHTLKTNLYNMHANIYKYFVIPYVVTWFLVSKFIEDNNYGISLSIITEYFKRLCKLFTENSAIQFFYILLVIGAISLFLNQFPKLFLSEKNTIDKDFWGLITLIFNSSMLTVIFLTFLGVFFILTDDVTTDLTKKFNISFFDVYSTLSLYYASCILLVKIVFNLSIKPFIESRKQNDDLLQSH